MEASRNHITVSGKVRPLDVEFLEEVADENWNGDCAVYAFNAGMIFIFTFNQPSLKLLIFLMLFL